jgi:two-component system OmpR family sensor kinase
MRNSLEYRLSFWLSVFVAATAITAGLVSYLWAFADANELQDDQLAQVAALAAHGQLPVAPQPVARNDGESEARVVIQRPGVDPATGAGPSLPADLSPGLHTVARGGETWRVLVDPLPSGERIAVAQRTALRDEIARDSALRTLLPLLVLIPALILLVAMVVRHTLRPVSRLSRGLDGRDEAGLDALPTDAVPAEIQPFVTSINRLHARVAASIERQRRFVADAAHELRSPITALTLQADNMARTTLPTEALSRLQALKHGLARMRALLEQLLSMARHQSVAEQVVPVALDQTARAVVAQQMAHAEDKQVDLGFGRLEPVCIAATPFELETLVRNVVDNAVRYTPAGGRVDVSVFADGAEAVLRVEDTGAGIAPQELERVFDPFYRAAGTAATGSGLGLSIVRSIADRLGGQVHLQNLGDEATSGLRFEYRQRLD